MGKAVEYLHNCGIKLTNWFVKWVGHRANWRMDNFVTVVEGTRGVSETMAPANTDASCDIAHELRTPDTRTHRAPHCCTNCFTFNFMSSTTNLYLQSNPIPDGLIDTDARLQTLRPSLRPLCRSRVRACVHFRPRPLKFRCIHTHTSKHIQTHAIHSLCESFADRYL